MSFKIDLASTMAQVVDTLANPPNKRNRDCGNEDGTVDFQGGVVTAKVAVYGLNKKRKEVQVVKNIHLLCFGYVNTWLNFDPLNIDLSRKMDFSWQDVSLNEWFHTSSHDSAWRSDGISTPLNNLSWKMRDRIKLFTKSNEEPIHEYNSLGGNGDRIFEPVHIRTVLVARRVGNGSWTDRVLVDIKSLDKELSSEALPSILETAEDLYNEAGQSFKM